MWGTPLMGMWLTGHGGSFSTQTYYKNHLPTMQFRRIIVAAWLFATTLAAQAQALLYPQHFNLSEVTLLDSPFRTARDLNNHTLLAYDADRLMAPFIRQAGLDKQAGKYQGWLDKHPSFTNWGLSNWSLEGHVGGHYLTALALAYASLNHDGASTEEQAVRQQLKERLDYCLNILHDCQEAYANDATGLKGFIGGQPLNDMWRKLYRGDTSAYTQFGGWVPLYCQHKVLAGLRDAYLYAGSLKAKEMFRSLCDWTIEVVNRYTNIENLLNSEHGGVNETLADAYALFGDDKYLEGAKKYCHQQMINGMANYNTTFLNNKHANTQVPKYIGFERICQLTRGAEPANYESAVHNFWTDVAQNRTVCIGGNSVDEHFLPATEAGRYIANLNGPETCNSNNMLKLSEDLFDDTHDARYADFYENTLYNHILATQDPTTGGYVYFTTLRPQAYRVYSQVNQGMWCCVGTGMENHAKYGHFIYTHSTAGSDTLFVNLFIASELHNDKYGILQETRFPYEPKTRLTVTRPGKFVIAVRQPAWASADGKATYTCYDRSWKKGDTLNVDLPMTLRMEPCPNLPQYVAFKYGPILLAGRTTARTQTEADTTGLAYEVLQGEYAGEGRMDHAPGSVATPLQLTTSPLLLCDRSQVLGMVQKIDTARLMFAIRGPQGVENASRSMFNTVPSITMEPFFSLHHSRYCVYWYQQSVADFAKSDLAAEEQLAAELQKRTLDYVGTGEQQSEAGHDANYSANSTKGSYNGEFYRDCGQGNEGYVEYTLTIPEERYNELAQSGDALTVMCRFTVADKGRKAKVSVDGTEVANVTIPSNVANKDTKGFYNDEYRLPRQVAYGTNGKLKRRFVFRIEPAENGTLCPGLYYLRLLVAKPVKVEGVPYAFHASDWVSGDEARVKQANISYDMQANTIKVKATGAQNTALQLAKVHSGCYYIPAEHPYLCVTGSHLSTATSAHQMWFHAGKWINIVNPVKVVDAGNGLQTVVWDMTQHMAYLDPVPLATTETFITNFGLTNTTGETVVSDISYQAEIPAKGWATGIAGTTIGNKANHAFNSTYNLAGQQLQHPQRGVNIISHKTVVLK